MFDGLTNSGRKLDKYEQVKLNSMWNDEEDSFSNDQYFNLLIEQYKIYVELADRVGTRRTLANVFFLIVNIIILSLLLIGLSRTNNALSMPLMFLPFIGLICLCYVWWRLVRFYRHLATIKDRVIGEIEKRLPASPMWKAEKDAMLRKGGFSPLKRIEFYTPYLFTLIYFVIYITLWVSPPWS